MKFAQVDRKTEYGKIGMNICVVNANLPTAMRYARVRKHTDTFSANSFNAFVVCVWYIYILHYIIIYNRQMAIWMCMETAHLTDRHRIEGIRM